MSKRIYRVQAGEPIIAAKRGHTMVCCDCGLAHKMNFYVVETRRTASGSKRVIRKVPGLDVVFKAWRAPQITGGVRSHRGKS